jgi:GNAT superfamily N-acetyltransferase
MDRTSRAEVAPSPAAARRVSDELLGPPAPEVRVLGPADQGAAAALLALGFDEEPGNLALLPDPEIRRELIETSVASTLRSTLPLGTVHGAWVGGELAAIAIWHPPGVATISVREVAHTVRGAFSRPLLLARSLPHTASVIAPVLPQAAALVRRRRRAIARASQGSAWHLAFLATAPAYRGQGLARALLERQLRRCDEDGAVVWLETTDPVNPPIYERFGFDTVEHIEDAAWLPGFWVMRRAPRTD